jgi:hypothetical protein
MESIVRHRHRISEVYFSWANFANGRNKATESKNFLPWEAHERQMEDLAYLADNGIRFGLLLNGNCYGKYSQSRKLFRQIDESVKYLSGRFGLRSVTTTSPLIAEFVKKGYPSTEVRASVNMDIGTIEGMEYVADYFDSFYMRRECNRKVEQIENLKSWCDSRGRKLYLLANSGCLSNCSARIFHDNLVSHEDEISEMDNLVEFKGLCWEFLQRKDHWVSFLTSMSFVRPEEMHLYEKWFDEAKLATRVHRHPEKVLESYFDESHSGSILDLCEPNHSGLMYPFLIENRLLPKDFNETQLTCNKNCYECGYCRGALERALINVNEILFTESRENLWRLKNADKRADKKDGY